MRNGKPHIKPSFRKDSRRESPPHTRAPNRGKDTPRPRQEKNKDQSQEGGAYWLYGHHALQSALQNPHRQFRRLIQIGHKGKDLIHARSDLPTWEEILPEQMQTILPKGAVHQGLAGLVWPLKEPGIEEICEAAIGKSRAILVILDQVTDPHNVGAIMRSAASFGAEAVILTERHAAPQSGLLAKAASGALDVVPLCRVVNLARSLEIIKKAGFWSVGLAGQAEKELSQIDLGGKIALILGSEENGLRRLTREQADFLARLPTSGPIDQLNVSNAAAIGLYEAWRQNHQ